MEKAFVGSSHVTGRNTSYRLWKGLGWGLIGGFTGTIVMDLCLMAAFYFARLPAFTCFSIIGNTISHFFSVKEASLANSILLGVLTHYLIGPLIGAMFGVLVTRVNALRVNTQQKTILLAILYVEVLSQPLLATSPILLKMTLPMTLLWYGGSFVMHFIAGAVMGTVVGRGLRLASSVNYR